LLAAWNFELLRIDEGKIGPVPERFGFGRSYPCWRTQVTYFVSAAWNAGLFVGARKRPGPNRPRPHAWNAARSFGLLKKPWPPPKGGLAPPDPSPPPDRGAPLEPAAPPDPYPPAWPGGRDGMVTPCFFRHATNAARSAELGRRATVEPLLAEEPLVLVEVLALLPHAARQQQAATAPTGSNPRLIVDMNLSLSISLFIRYRTGT
jgi:hypothetical protein